jgi:acyl carrier protein
MVPAEYALLDELPLTASDKVDRRKLAALTDLARPAAGGASAAPRDVLEERVSRIWGEVLHATDVRTADDFFDLGGDSLLAVTLVHEIGRQLGVELPVSAVFRGPTVAELAAAVRERSPRAAGGG